MIDTLTFNICNGIIAALFKGVKTMNIEQVFEVVREELNEIYEEYEFSK